MTFDDPGFLLVTALVVLVVVGAHARHAHRRRRLGDFFGGARGATRVSASGLYGARSGRLLLLGLATLALGLGAAGPLRSPPGTPAPAARAGSAVIAVDVSVSMQAADVRPTRLARAVEAAESLLGGLGGTRVGLVLFAGAGYTLTPPTNDPDVAAFFLEGIGPTVMSFQDPGSLLTAGIGEAARLLISEGGSAEPAIVLITDGESGESEEAVLEAVRAVAARGIAVHAVGVGTSRGAEMSVSGAGSAGALVRDRTGTPGVSRAQAALLQRVADAGGGEYASASDAAALRRVRRAAGSGSAPVMTTPLEAAGADTGFVLAGAGLLFLLLESLVELKARQRAWTGPARYP
ncbi:MAG: VWA domain-containing protein [Gammaproteobacteria bacterium]|nr:VWA domain-containing protein [Gammaproteobacteria bacterium]